MTELNLFSENQETPENIENIDYEAQLIGEGKRYKDVKVAAKALVDKDQYIARLERENEAARSALKGEQKIDDLLTQLKSVKAPVVSPPSNEGNQPSEPAGNQNANPNPNTPPPLSLTDVEALLEKKELQKARTNNFTYSVEKVKEAFGADYKATLASITQNLGVEPDFLNNLAATQPQVFLKLVGADNVVRNSSVTPPSTVRTAGLGTGSSNEKNAAYYSKLRKQLGDAAYFDKKIQNELHRNAQRLGEAFFI